MYLYTFWKVNVLINYWYFPKTHLKVLYIKFIKSVFFPQPEESIEISHFQLKKCISMHEDILDSSISANDSKRRLTEYFITHANIYFKKKYFIYYPWNIISDI